MHHPWSIAMNCRHGGLYCGLINSQYTPVPLGVGGEHGPTINMDRIADQIIRLMMVFI